MTFTKWLDTFIQEKGIEDQVIEVEGDSGLNIIPLAVLVEAIKSACQSEQKSIKSTLVKIDFANGNVMHFFNHLAKAVAI